jgi:hypothetical protein
MVSKMRRLLILLVLVLESVAQVRAEDILAGAEYQPGSGWQLPGTGFGVGGYASGGVSDEPHPSNGVGLDHFSLFLHWEGAGKLRLFSELDFENPLSWVPSNGLTTDHAYLALERLYADYLYSENLNFRVGKYLTPIGRWNVIHAAPLVWTTSRPLITERTFPTNATGAMVYGTLPLMDHEIDYSVYTAVGSEWRADPRLDPFSQAYGLHLSMPTSNLGEFGVSYANFEQESATSEHKNLLGVDYFWSRDRYEVSSELVYRFSDQGHQLDEKGLFIQGVAPIMGRWYAIARYELYQQAGPAPAMNLYLAGVAMRLTPAMLLKAEFSHATHNEIQAPVGFYASFAILF